MASTASLGTRVVDLESIYTDVEVIQGPYLFIKLQTPIPHPIKGPFWLIFSFLSFFLLHSMLV
jgi:hypothetical protein